MTPSGALNAAVFASGSGSNFQALLDAERSGGTSHPWRSILLISDRESAGALDRAEAAGVARRVIPVGGRDPGAVAGETLDALLGAEVDVIFLAGYLRLVPAPVVERFRGRILNIHPALLPAFGGKGMWGRHVHQAVLDAGARVTGPTVHVVDEVYDRGLILAQWPVPVRNGDTPETLAARVLAEEHRLYPQVAAHLCRSIQEGRRLRPLEPSGGSFVLE
jgi:phosphoribosylglycinamide formyltransferase-1